MTGHSQRQFPARMTCLDEALGFAESFCRACGVAQDDALRLRLIVEELFTNTVEHGHGGDSDNPIALALAADDSRVQLDYEDTAAAFDPLSWLKATEPMRDAAPIGPGGQGLRLVVRLAASMTYARENDRNRLRLVLVRRAGPDVRPVRP